MQIKVARSSTPTTSRAICRTTLNYQQKRATTARARHLSARTAVGKHPPRVFAVKRSTTPSSSSRTTTTFGVRPRRRGAHSDLPIPSSRTSTPWLLGAVQDLTQVLRVKKHRSSSPSRHPRERMASLSALVTMAPSVCLGATGKGLGPLPSCFMTEGMMLIMRTRSGCVGLPNAHRDEAWAVARPVCSWRRPTN